VLTPAAGPAFRFVRTVSVSVLTVALFLGWGRVSADPATLSIDSPTVWPQRVAWDDASQEAPPILVETTGGPVGDGNYTWSTVWGPLDFSDPYSADCHVEAEAPGTLRFKVTYSETGYSQVARERTIYCLQADIDLGPAFNGSTEWSMGAVLPVDIDDDDGNGVADCEDESLLESFEWSGAQKADMYQIFLSYQPTSLGGRPSLDLIEEEGELGEVWLWRWDNYADTFEHIEFPFSFTSDDLAGRYEYWLQGRRAGPVGLEVTWTPTGDPSVTASDAVRVQVWAPTDIEVEGIADEGIGSMLDANLNPGGGWRIFPGKTDPDDTWSRRRVRVRANIGLAREGVPVYFEAFDVDDPSAPGTGPGQLEDPDGIIDDETQPTDNRGPAGGFVPTGFMTAEATTDAEGWAEVEFEVGWRPGDNYRFLVHGLWAFTGFVEWVAGPPPDWLEWPAVVAVQDDGTEAGLCYTLGAKDRVKEAYLSDLLTVWRWLWVESDAMQADVNDTNLQVRNLEQATYQQWCNQTELLIDPLDADFREPQHHVLAGALWTQGLPTVLTILNYCIAGTHDYIYVSGNRTSTEGDEATIADDDHNFLQIGFPMLVSYPRHADASLLGSRLAYAYVVPIVYTASSSQIPFDRNVTDNELATLINTDFQWKDAVCEAFWAIHLVSAHQPQPKPISGYENYRGFGDYDPDSESAALGAAIEEYHGGAVFLEVCRDQIAIANVEPLTTCHEIGHCLGADDGDGELMDAGFGNGYFTTVSLDKIRDNVWP